LRIKIPYDIKPPEEKGINEIDEAFSVNQSTSSVSPIPQNDCGKIIPLHQNPANQNAESEAENKPNQAERIIRLFNGDQFFHTPENETFVTIHQQDHLETYALTSSEFKSLLSLRFYQHTGSCPNTQSVTEAIGTLTGRALFGGPEIPVFVRIVPHGEDIFIDLGDQSWSAVHIARNGWSIIAKPPVKFRRPPGMLELPKPVLGGSIDILRPFLNMQDDASWRLIVGFLLAALHPKGPYPILEINGEAGSAKSTLTRVLKALVDPCKAPIRSMPSNERELVISARNSHLLAYDNISRLPPKISDALCRISTGGGHSTRKLYTDSEEVFFDGQRPIILNGIANIVVRGDLQDRSIKIDLESISSENRQDEKSFWQKIEEARPKILGVLLSAVSCGLRNSPNVQLQNLPRMADFIKWVTACESGLGWSEGTINNAYQQAKDQSIRDTLDLDPVAQKIIEMVDQQSLKGTASELLKELGKVQPGKIPDPDDYKFMPKKARSLTVSLKRLAPNLRHIGIDIHFLKRTALRKEIIIKRSKNLPSLPSLASSSPSAAVPPMTQTKPL